MITHFFFLLSDLGQSEMKCFAQGHNALPSPGTEATNFHCVQHLNHKVTHIHYTGIPTVIIITYTHTDNDVCTHIYTHISFYSVSVLKSHSEEVDQSEIGVGDNRTKYYRVA